MKLSRTLVNKCYKHKIQLQQRHKHCSKLYHIPLRFQSTNDTTESKTLGSLSTLQGKALDNEKQSNDSDEHKHDHESSTVGQLSTNQGGTIEQTDHKRTVDTAEAKTSSDSRNSTQQTNNSTTEHKTDDTEKQQTDDLKPKTGAHDLSEPVAGFNNDLHNTNHTISNKYTAASPNESQNVAAPNPVQSTDNTHNTDSNDTEPIQSTASNSPQPASEIRGLLWFDNLYPMRAAYIDFRHFLVTHNHESQIPKIMNKACKTVKITEMIPRIKEGGVFVRFTTTDTTNYPSAESVAENVIKELKQHPRRAWLTPQPIHVHLVYGSPFLEDLLRVFPANRLRIELKADIKLLAEITVEQLYEQLRPFGVISEMSLGAVPDKPNIARVGTVIYQRMYGAVGARNCLHRFKIPIGSGGAEAQGVAMYLYYESLLKTSMIADFFNKHTRIMVPILGLLFALITFLVFDPIREFNVINHITKRFTLHRLEDSYSNSRIVQWFNKQYQKFRSSKFLSDMIGQRSVDSKNIEIVWSGRKLDEDKVTKWLHSIPDRILFLTGPKGAGKLALVDKVTKDKPNVVRIEFSNLMDRNDDEFVKGLSAAVGFRPGFSFLTFVSQLLDVITPGASKATGSQSQFSSQIDKVLEVTANSLVEIAKKYHPASVEVKHATSATSNATLAHTTPTGKRIQIDPNRTATHARNDTSPIMEKTDGLDKAVDKAVAAPNESKTTTQAPKPSSNDTSDTSGNVKVDNTDGEKKSDNILSSVTNTVTNTVTGLFVSDNKDSEKQVEQPADKRSDDTNKQDEQAKTEPIKHHESSDSDEHTDHLPHETTTSFWNRLLGIENELKQRTPRKHSTTDHRTHDHDDSDDSESHHIDNNSVEHDNNDNIPLFIIDGFNTDNKEKHNNFMLMFTGWADSMTKLGLARFLYLSDSTLEEYIAKSLPDVKLTEVMLADANKENAIEFVQSSMRRIREADKQHELEQRRTDNRRLFNRKHETVAEAFTKDKLQSDIQQQHIAQADTEQHNDSATQNNMQQIDTQQTAEPDQATIDAERDAHELQEIKQAIDIVGGRYNDLQTLVRGLESGSTPRSCVEDMVSVAINSVRSVLFSEDKNHRFTKVQLWLTMNKLISAPKNQLLYDDLLFNIFKGDDQALRQLVRLDLLRIEQQPHSKDRIKAGSGIQLEAFKRMIQLEKLRPGFDLAVAKSMLSDEQKKINEYEDELLRLSNIMHNELDMRKYLQNDENIAFHGTGSTVSGTITAASIAKRRIDLLRLLNDSVDKYTDWDIKRRKAEAEIKKTVQLNKEPK